MISNDKQAILVASFGTSYAETRRKTIDALEHTIIEAFPDYTVRRAFTSNHIIQKLRVRDNLTIHTVNEALHALLDDGFVSVTIQPTHVINGEEYEKIVNNAAPFRERFQSLRIGTPLLTETQDYLQLITAIIDDFPALRDDQALILMGHGTEHYTNASYAALDYMFKEQGYSNVFVGTVEAYPTIDTVLRQVKSLGVTEVILAPLMLVAGDHIINDMAGTEDDSWRTLCEQAGLQVTCILKGLAENPRIRDIYLSHLHHVLNQDDQE